MLVEFFVGLFLVLAVGMGVWWSSRRLSFIR